MITTYIQKALEKILSSDIYVYAVHHVGGGFVNQTYKVITSLGTYFIKAHLTDGYPKMFVKEVNGLNELISVRSINVAKPIGICEVDKYSFLVLEWIEPAPSSADYWWKLGEGIAKLHLNTARNFGFKEDNYIGSLVQYNSRANNWGQFYVKNRLMPQVKKATEEGFFDDNHLALFDRYYVICNDVFPDEPPALLHGDLWTGNVIPNQEGLPCLVDPAVYYGHREMDIAMTQFVGSFDPKFYEAYQTIYPLKEDWEFRKDFANMYYLLVHLNLFGLSYLPNIEANLNKWVGSGNKNE